ncbi:DUF6385 domain-containing protein [Clostridium sp. MB40-C1]|uniref:DUF6385 domain-containing protein n=1 Tax=Clostridium sp. MB40-C1 TaxID=3070996 RepID=UPI0027E00A10|nr:DUF6385 domain-containing protein [Clostridium sp. MB40-C1]WMJ81127.1 DUF6385 domain-containing protein [Clostridium sp. MB40-C1]
MLTQSPKIYTEDEKMIEVGEDILNWLESYTPPPLASNVNMVGRKFEEYELVITTSSSFQYTNPFDTSQYSTVTFFVKNIGSNPAKVRLQISPKQTEVNYGYVDDSPIVNVGAGEIIALVPMIFGKYTRIAYKSDISTDLEIIMQAHI